MATSPKANACSMPCADCGVQFCWLNLIVNLALAGIKGFIGIVAASRALLAGALYSVNDVLSAAIVLVSLRVARRPPDQDHAYGHGKAEFIAVGIVSLVLLLAVLFIIVSSVADIFAGVAQPPHLVAVLVALVTLAINEFLARRGFCAARRLGSPALHTCAEHNRADAVSSLATVVGVSGAAVGLHFLDPLVAIFETVHIVWLSGTLLGGSVRGLMDAALPVDERNAVIRAVEALPGVLSVGALRSRQAGPKSWVDIEVRTGGTVGEASAISAQVRRVVPRVIRRPVETQVKLRSGGDGPVPRRAARARVAQHA